MSEKAAGGRAASGEPRRWRWQLGFRGEILFLLPAALLLVLLVSLFTLFSYRNALDLFADERRTAAAQIAGAAANTLAAADRPAAEALHRAAPEAERVLLVSADGTVLASWSDPRASLPAGEPLAALAQAGAHSGASAAAGLTAPLGLGPGDGLPDGVVAGFAPLGPPASRRVLRCDLPSRALAGQIAAIGPLTALVLAADAAVLILLLFFLRHLLIPFDALLERARRLGDGDGEVERDEVAFLLGTFERAVEALARPGDAADAADAAEADIAALSRTLGVSLDSGVLLLDHRARVLALNAVGAELLGLDEPPPGAPLEEVLVDHPRLAELIADAVAGRRGVRRAEVEIASPDTAADAGPGAGSAAGEGGERRTLGITAHPLRRNDGAVRGYLALFADLTESRRRAEEARLEQSLAQLGELSAGIAHELRNSLATLRGYLTLIARGPAEERVGDYLAEIRRETDHLQRVLEDFLAFARPGTARIEPVALAAITRRAAADPALGPGAEAEGVTVAVTVDAAAESALLPGDPSLLERAVRNLLHNAVRAQREAGDARSVEVAVTAPAGGLEIRVADRGPGVPAAMRHRLFHPFSTGHADGVGLGLALTHRIATLHGGTVRLEERPGGGSVAVLAFPADGAATPSSEGRADGDDRAGD